MHIETQASAPDEEHAEFDPASLREHEEFTKVKNINRIEIGKYDVETWCVCDSQSSEWSWLGWRRCYAEKGGHSERDDERLRRAHSEWILSRSHHAPCSSLLSHTVAAAPHQHGAGVRGVAQSAVET
jgi:hypothetical protein